MKQVVIFACIAMAVVGAVLGVLGFVRSSPPITPPSAAVVATPAEPAPVELVAEPVSEPAPEPIEVPAPVVVETPVTEAAVEQLPAVEPPAEDVEPLTGEAYIEAVYQDIHRLQIALEYYRTMKGVYPIGDDWDGLQSNFGSSRPDWIRGLAPKYIPVLPLDPRKSDDPDKQYLYKSDGVGYKLIAHDPEDCRAFLKVHPEMADPRRDCWAVGVYTPNAALW